MVSSSAILSIASAFAMCVQHVQAHGYMYIPLAEFDGSATANWIVQIAPQWTGDWDGADGDSGLVALYKELKASNNVDNIRTLLDSDTSLYGADCGFTDPDVTAKDPPTDGTATFSRGMVHAGPCEIWLDDTLALSNDDCQSAYGDGTQATASIFQPMDYSSCSSSGCMLRFYWLALQVLDGETVWQVYKDCVPLSGPASGTTSTATTTSTTSSTTTDESSTTEVPSTDEESSTTEAPASESSAMSDEDSTEAPEATTAASETSDDDAKSVEASTNDDDNDEKSSEESAKSDDDDDEKKSEDDDDDDDDDDDRNRHLRQ
ncbi:hypothetical protein BBJ28_00019751 [Nothophytophthora sp. Chile5]|nr:hypothetical protein BBJ28_00019751 [Nothophytophthora sp. Chile5]